MLPVLKTAILCLVVLDPLGASHINQNAAKCPPDKPNKCPPYGKCFSNYYYCSTQSKGVEPCLEESILSSRESRLVHCKDIFSGKNLTAMIRDESCNITGSCFSEFGALDDKITGKQDSLTWLIIIIISIAVVVVGKIIHGFIICYIQKKKCPCTAEEELAQHLNNNYGQPPVNIELSNNIQEPCEETRNHNCPSLESEYHTESDHLLQRTNTTNGSRNQHPSGNSIVSSPGEEQEESQHTTPTNSAQQNGGSTFVHPAEIESGNLRHINMPESCFKRP